MATSLMLVLGMLILAFLILIYCLMTMNPRPAKPKKSAITNPPWASFVCPECGHQDGNTADVVQCANCWLIVLRAKR